MSNIIDLKSVFFPTAQLKVLFFLCHNPNKEFFDKELFDLIGDVSRASVNNALNTLAGFGLIKRERKGKICLNSINSEKPEIKYFKKLSNIIEAVNILSPAKDLINKAILFGSYSTGENSADSDIDVFIIAKNSNAVKDKIGFHDRLQLIIKKPSEMIKFRNNNEVFEKEIQKGITLWDKANEENL